MSRCAACGSKSVAYGTKNEGFSVGKAVAGTIFFGPVGAVAGTAGKKKGYYHCGACGSDLGYLMLDFTENDIDRALADPAKYESTLIRYKQRYCNIEWQPSASVANKLEPPKDSCAGIISKINARSTKVASIREQALLLYKYCLENNIASFPIYDESYVNQMFKDIAKYLTRKGTSDISKFDFEKICKIANAYGYIDCQKSESSNKNTTATVSQNKTQMTDTRIKYLKQSELSLLRKALDYPFYVDEEPVYFCKEYIKGVLTAAFADKTTMTPDELQVAVGIILSQDGISSDMSVIEELSYDLAFSTGKLPNFIYDYDKYPIRNNYDPFANDYIIGKQDGLLTLHKKTAKQNCYVFDLDLSSLALNKKDGGSSNKVDRTFVDDILVLLDPDALFEKYKSVFTGDKIFDSGEAYDTLGKAFSQACGVMGIGYPGLANGLCAEGALEKECKMKKIYYTLPGGFKRNEAKKAREQAIANNNAINAQIAQLNTERANQSRIYEEFKSKIFGEGARKKKEALARINAIDAEIAALKTKIQRV